MWPRLCELLLAAWLAASPFVLGHWPADRTLWLNDLVCAGLIAACALLSLNARWRYAHLGELLVALWLLGFGYAARPEPLPALQNDILVALVLAMFAVIPTQSNDPPESWRGFSDDSGSFR
jgi:hypothetical protein